MNQTPIKVIEVLAIIIVIALVLFFWLRPDQPSELGDDSSVVETDSLGGELLESAQNPIKDKVAETNPFETESNPFSAETNPFQDVKTNPFSD